MKERQNRAMILLAAMCSMVLLALSVMAQPNGIDDFEVGTSERASTIGGGNVQAQAGNATPLKINATGVTVRWQAFYGNVSGQLTLEDGNGNSIYQWDDSTVEGEIYAVNHSSAPVWTNIICFNMTAGSTQNITITELENSLGITDANDDEGVNETFNLTFTGSLSVGDSITLTEADGCRVVSLNVNDAYNELRFNETLLTDNSSDKVIYTQILEQDQTGFQGSTLDFEMIVGENGDNTDITNYYFYVELS